MKGKGLLGLLAVTACAAVVGLGSLEGLPAREKGELPADLEAVPRSALVVVSLRPGDVWASDLGKGVVGKLGDQEKKALAYLDSTLGVPLKDVERFTVAVLDAGPDTSLVSVLASKPVSREAVLKTFAPKAREEKVAGKAVFVSGRSAVYFASDKAYLAGGVEGIKGVLEKPEGKGAMQEALALAAGKHSGVLAVNVAELMRSFPGELPPEVEPFKPILKAKLLTATVDVGATTTAKARLRFASAAEARAADKAVRTLLKLAAAQLEGALKEAGKAKDMKDVADLLKTLHKTLAGAAPLQDGAELKLEASAKLEPGRAAGQVVMAAARIRDASARTRSANNLKQIGLALHNYHDTHGHFPPHAIFDKDGKPTVSWRVLILPYVEGDALYKEFKLDEPWDGPHNKKLLAKMPRVYADPKEESKVVGGTYYQAFVGNGAFFEGKKGLRIADISDGTSNTIAVVEAAKEVPWSKPEDLPYAPGKPLPKVGGLFPNGFNALLCDGSVRFLRRDIKEMTLRALITRNGGEVIADD